MRDRILVSVTLLLCLTVLAGGLVLYLGQPIGGLVPNPRRPAAGPTSAAPSQGVETERGLCALIDRPQGLASEIVRATVASGQLDYTLSMLAEQYARDPSPGSREQVLRECRRLGAL